MGAVRKPLGDVRILDLTTGPADGVGRLLAELGADVAKIEPRGGDSERTAGLCAGSVGLAFAAANLGKNSVALSLDRPDDRALFDELAGRAHLVLRSAKSGSAEAELQAIEALRHRHLDLVVLSLPDFGAGPCQDWTATDPVLQAMNGELSRSGISGRPPLLPPGELAVQCAVAHAAYVAMLGCLQRQQTGRGDHLESSLLEGSVQALDPGYGIAGSAASGVMADQLPRGRPNMQQQYPVFACKDGHVRLCVLARRQWLGLFEWMGRPLAFADPSFHNLEARNRTPALMDAVGAFLAGKSCGDIEAESQRFRVPAAAVMTLDEALDSQHVRGRRLLCGVELAPGFAAPFPSGLIKIDGQRAASDARLPAADGCAATLLRRWSSQATPPRIVDFGEPGRPLKGIRVLDLGVIVVGAEQGRLMADYGAEVIKVESAAFPDGIRATSPNGMSPGIAAGHRNKRGLGLNLRSDEGRALFLKLLEQADVVLSNFKPGTMDALGLAAETMLERNPRLIVVESSAYGKDGPWSARMGYGPLVRASAGLTALWRYADGAADFGDTVTTYPDHVAARISISAVLALLLRRARTGTGGQIDLAQMEVIFWQMGAAVAANRLDRRGVALTGDARHDAPWGAFPAAGDDDWCVVSIRGDDEWQALCRVMNRDDLADDRRLQRKEDRIRQRARIDDAVAAWTRSRPAEAAAAALQNAGVPAAKMLRVSELPEVGYFRGHAMFQTMNQPQLPRPVKVDNLPVRSGRLARPPLGPAPMPGEHSIEIVRDLLRLDPGDIARLIANGVLETPSAQGDVNAENSQ
ncbi:MAG: CoA transferase [Bradyrhizobium sp.]|nr:CoA transferase [Bradyrhizobium sp.]